jgi:hypothetical protein
MMGLFTVIFVKDRIKSRITSLKSDNVKCGLNGTLGNKGATMIRMDIDNSSLSFSNCHLSSG